MGCFAEKETLIKTNLVTREQPDSLYFRPFTKWESDLCVAGEDSAKLPPRVSEMNAAEKLKGGILKNAVVQQKNGIPNAIAEK